MQIWRLGDAGGEEQKPTSTQMEVIIVPAESVMVSPYSLTHTPSAQLQMAGWKSMTEESVPWTFPLHDSIQKCLLIYGSVVFQLTVHDGVATCIFSFSA